MTRREGSDLFRSTIRNIYDTDNLLHQQEKEDFFRGYLRGFRVAGGEKSPDRRSRLKLSQERDPLGQQKSDLTLHINENDYVNIEKSLKIIATELGRTGEGRLRWPGFSNDISSRKQKKNIRNIIQRVMLPCHHMGTTRMSTEAQQGVVDAHCRVHGIKNLYIAGSSVFPTCGFANPTLTLVALAIRLADHLKKESF